MKVPVIKLLPLLVLISASRGLDVEIRQLHDLHAPQHPGKLDKSETLKKFVQLVEKHSMNVSIIVSTIQKWRDGTPKQILALTAHFPPNDVKVTQSKLDERVANEILRVATAENLPARVTESTEGKLIGFANNASHIPDTEAFRLLTTIKNGKTGIGLEGDNFAALYSFKRPNDETTSVLYGNMNVEILKKEQFSDQELEIVKRAFGVAALTHDSDNLPRAVVALVDTQLADFNWQVISHVHEGDKHWLGSDKWASVKVSDNPYYIFAI